MSIAPANKASIAEGPALKLFHSIFTCGPIAFSNQALLLPTIACGCVMLGKAPTRMTVCPAANAPSTKNKLVQTRKLRLVMAHVPRRYGQHVGLGFFLPRGFPIDRFRAGTGRLTADQVGQRRILQNLRGC